MADENQNQYSQAAVVTDVNVKLRDIEEKQNLIKDRILLIGENLVAEKHETEAELFKLKTRLAEAESDIKKIKLALQRITESQETFARKSELDILSRQFEMFQPMEIARISDVEDIVRRMLQK